MLKSFVILSLRLLRKNRLYSGINVLGLALGVACCLVTFIIIRFETSFDDFHSKAERIYRVNLKQQTSHGLQLSGYNFTPLTEAIREEVTGLENVTGVYCLHSYQFSRDNNLLEDKFAFFADEEYCNVFDVQWIAGNPKKALTESNSVVVTDGFAEKFLGGAAHAMGSSFILENRLTLTVTGVIKTPPLNTDHPYSILISFQSLPQFFPEATDNWKQVFGGATYILTHDGSSLDQINSQLNGVIRKHMDLESAKKTSFHLMPLNDNHDRNYDYSSFTYDFPVPVMIMLSIMAGMIAFIACINFVNLSTAQSMKRAREVGIRKTMGSSKTQLIAQHMSEALVITVLAVLTGIVMAKIGMMQLNTVYGGEYLNFNLLKEPYTLGFVAILTMLISVFSGFYPAFVLSRYQPVLALRSQTFSGKTRGFSLRKSLVVSQFAGAQILILVTAIMINQITHFRDRPIGFDPETILLIPHLKGNDHSQHSRLDRELSKVPGVISHSLSYALPEGGDPVEFHKTGEDQKTKTGFINYVDLPFTDVFNIQVISGTNFSSDLAPGSTEVIVNEALIRKLDFRTADGAIGAVFNVGETEVVIRGVVKDFYTQAMSNSVDPVIIQYDPNKMSGVAMRVSTENLAGTIAGIEAAWKNVYPEYLCKYEFMDDVMRRRYGFFNTIFTFLGVASVVAIFISCLGMYGLVSFMAIQRTKEIGIRKVFGATVKNIMTMFSRESAALIVIAFVIAAPLSHFLGIAMMMELPERITPGVGVYGTVLLSSLAIALLTVTYRSFVAAIQNPIESLKTD